MTVADLTTRLDALRSRTPAMVAALEHLTTIESPSSDLAATRRCADAVIALAREQLGASPTLVERDGRPHVLLGAVGRPAEVLLLGHFDTVWPMGTIDRWPFQVDVAQDRATGPGTFDMKSGVVQAIFAMAALDDLHGVSLLLTSDEEIGSPTSRSLIEDAAAGCKAVLVLEPGQDGAAKIARKGVSMYVLSIEGKASHAGLNPADGVNATVEAAHHVLAVDAMGRPQVGTTVTPTMLTSGTATNVVPAAARVSIDVRAESFAEQMRVDEELRRLAPQLAGARLSLEGGPNRPPLAQEMSAALFAEARAVAGELGLGDLRGVAVGGGSDGNFTAGMGVPTLDGLGAVGDGAHAEGEHIVVSAMAERAALVAGLIDRVRGTAR